MEWTRACEAWDEKGKGITNTKALAAHKAKELKKSLLSTYDNVNDWYNKLFKYYIIAVVVVKEHCLII